MRKIFDFVIFFPLLKFTFKSFSFNEAGNERQKITCNINFCLKDNNECENETDLAKLLSTCNAAEPEKWTIPYGSFSLKGPGTFFGERPDSRPILA